MKLLVRNLARSITEPELKTLFEAFGAVQSCSLVLDTKSGGSKGFGFIEMPEQSEGQKAIEELDGQDVDGRNIRVNEARPKEDKPRGGGGGNW